MYPSTKTQQNLRRTLNVTPNKMLSRVACSLLMLFFVGCGHSLDERLSTHNRKSNFGAITSIELPEAIGDSQFVFSDAETAAFSKNLDSVSIFDYDLNESNKHSQSYNSKVKIQFGDGKISRVMFSTTFTEATGHLFELEIDDGGFQGALGFCTPMDSFLSPERQTELLEHLTSLK